MEREKRKRVIAYGLMIFSVVFFFFGEYPINNDPLIVHKYFIERIVATCIIWLAGYIYLEILEGRIERYKKR